MAKAVKQQVSGIQSTLGALISHPTRVQAYVVFNERVASPTEVAREINESVNHVSYHVDKLRELGVIELVREEQVRGAIEHFYKAVQRPVASEDGLNEMSAEERSWLTRYILQLAVADAALAIDAGVFDARLNRALVRVPLTVDEEGFAELTALHEELYEKELEVAARSAGRMAEDGTEPISTIAVNWFHEVPAKRSKTPSNG